MNTTNAVELYRNSSTHPIRFDRLHENSLFKIVDERSRPGYRRNTDDRLYRKAKSHEGFFATRVSDQAATVLMPEDLVMPMVPVNAKKKAR